MDAIFNSKNFLGVNLPEVKLWLWYLTVFQIIVWACPNGLKYAKDDRQYSTAGL